MEQGDIVLCGANSTAEKYYLNPLFAKLPSQVQEELRTLSVLFTAEFGGTLLFKFTEEGELQLETVRDEDELFYDDIGAELKIRRMQRENEELFTQLETYFRLFVLKEEL